MSTALERPRGLPAGWIPENKVVRIVACRDDESWRAMIPSFDVEGRGGTLTAAVDDSVGHLHAYFGELANAGKSYAEAEQNVSAPWRLVALMLFGFACLKYLNRENREMKVLKLPISPLERDDQAWFWDAAWQRGEAEATQELEAGRGTTYESTEDFLASLSE